MEIGQGHDTFGRYAKGVGLDPIHVLTAAADPASGAPRFSSTQVTIRPTGRSMQLASTSGSRIQHGRKIALAVGINKINKKKAPERFGLGMHEFPLTLPLPEGYNRKRDIYPPHDPKDYRWSIIVDLDRCIGCGACIDTCDQGALSLDESKADPKKGKKVQSVVDLTKCILCGYCAEVCPEFTIRII